LRDRREHAIGVLFLLLTAGCWGFVASTVKRLTAEVDPYTISFSRVSLATAVFCLLFTVRGGNWRRIRWALPWIGLGALGRAGNYLLYNAGLTLLPSNASTILAPVQTIGVIFLARWAAGERAHAKWLGLLLSLTGLLLIWWNGRGWEVLIDERHSWGNTLLVAAGVASALQFTSQKVLSVERSSLEILIPVFGLSTALTYPFAWSAGGLDRSYAPATWGWILFLGLVLTGGSFLTLAEGYKRVPATTAVVITNSSTFLTLIWSHALLGERVSAVMVVGAVLGLAGTVAVIRTDQSRLRARAPAGL
jgi:drug/metabolite transporter (DMT)-like permease